MASIAAADLDGDGDADLLSNLGGGVGWHRNPNTDPLNPDTDGDGLLDGFEVANGFDPGSGGEQAEDPDADGLDNLGEQAAATDPNDPDSDGDTFSDGVEVAAGSDPNDPLDFPSPPRHTVAIARRARAVRRRPARNNTLGAEAPQEARCVTRRAGRRRHQPR